MYLLCIEYTVVETIRKERESNRECRREQFERRSIPSLTALTLRRPIPAHSRFRPRLRRRACDVGVLDVGGWTSAGRTVGRPR